MGKKHQYSTEEKMVLLYPLPQSWIIMEMEDSVSHDNESLNSHVVGECYTSNIFGARLVNSVSLLTEESNFYRGFRR